MAKKNTKNISLDKIKKEFINFSLKFKEFNDYQIVEGNRYLRITNYLEIKDISDDVCAHFTFSEFGYFSIEFIFDMLDETEENLILINEYNYNVVFFKAYINEDGYLTFAHDGLSTANEKKLINDILCLSINTFIADDNISYIKKIINFTYKSN